MSTKQELSYTVSLVETYGHDPARAEQGLELWRRFARAALIPAVDGEGTERAIADGAKVK